MGSPEMHGAITGCFKNTVVGSLNTGSVRPAQEHARGAS
jgi:hypothetical protein